MQLEVPADLPEGIRQERARQGLSQEQLGELLAAPSGLVNDWESGRSTPTGPARRQILRLVRSGLAVAGSPNTPPAVARAAPTNADPRPPVTNLPLRLSSFIGQAPELAEMTEL